MNLNCIFRATCNAQMKNMSLKRYSLCRQLMGRQSNFPKSLGVGFFYFFSLLWIFSICSVELKCLNKLLTVFIQMNFFLRYSKAADNRKKLKKQNKTQCMLQIHDLKLKYAMHINLFRICFFVCFDFVLFGLFLNTVNIEKLFNVFSQIIFSFLNWNSHTEIAILSISIIYSQNRPPMWTCIQTKTPWIKKSVF